MTIVLVNIRTTKVKYIHPPFGLLYLGTALKKKRYPVKIFHILYDQLETVAEKIVKLNPLFVGISVCTGRQTQLSAKLSKNIKKKSQ